MTIYDGDCIKDTCFSCIHDGACRKQSGEVVAYVISRYTNANGNYKRHIVDADGKPLCMSHTRSFTLEYTTGQCDCKRCAKKKVEQS